MNGKKPREQKYIEPQENLKDKKPEQELIEDIYSPEYFAAHAEEMARRNREFEKGKDNEERVSPEDYDFLTGAGFLLERRKEIETDAGTMIEIPRNKGRSAFVKAENFLAWINHLKDKQELSNAKQGLNDAYEKEKLSPELEGLSQEELETLRGGFNDLAESVNKLYRGLLEREQQGLNPLIDSENIEELKTSTTNLESIIESSKIEDSLLRSAITKIINAVESIGNVSKKRKSLNEDEESLISTASLLNLMGEECLQVSQKLGGIEKYDAKKLQELIQKLDESAQNKRGYVVRKIEAFQNYKS